MWQSKYYCYFSRNTPQIYAKNYRKNKNRRDLVS